MNSACRVWVVFLMMGTALGQTALLFESLDIPEAGHYGEIALNDLGLSVTSAGLTDFNTSLANGSWDIVVIDAFDAIPVVGSDDWDALQDYIDNGGRVAMSFWDAQGDTYSGLDVLESFGVNRSGVFVGSTRVFSANYSDMLRPVNKWDDSSTSFFTGISDPIVPTLDKHGTHGSFLVPRNDAGVIAGYGASPGSPITDGAIVVGANRQTVYNGFLVDELSPGDGVQLWRNQISYLLNIPEPRTIVLFAPVLGYLCWRMRRKSC